MAIKVTFDRTTCIGAFACVAAAPDHWKYADDGKVDLAGAKDEGNGKFSLVVEEQKLIDSLKASAEACPVYAIKIEEI